MLWIAQTIDSRHIVGIFHKEWKAFDLYGDNDNVEIYWTESDL